MEENYPVLSGAEAFYQEGNDLGILVIHGFTGSPQSMRPLAETYAKSGYTVAMPRLSGHGTHYEDMEKTSYKDWVASVEEALDWLKKRTRFQFVVGLSMGGTLALHLAKQHDDLKGIVLINAAIEIQQMEALREEENQSRYLESIHSDIQKEGVKELAYDKVPYASVIQLLDLLHGVRADLANVHCPALIFVSDEDHVVPPDNAQYIFDTIFSEHTELVHLENSYHVATLDYDFDLIIERSLEFFQQYTMTK
ncbi:carboxylesterase [Thalassobacillus cyri]|uniref:Carboxylesterase n=1 Tax=Thalassobacillus cyri TaxID=571932 RepID=A0A1H4FSZ7_9BACI|nr:alpha/beta fold hydrolase [Thalassobacillus cyri]SEA99642.1 carboxylesterase [Thalassobacillus cyri]